MKLSLANKQFTDQVSKYQRSDALMAIGLFIIMNLVYICVAVLEKNFAFIKENSIIVGCGLNGMMIIITILFIKIKKEHLSSIGLYQGKWKQSCLIGGILASILFFNNCLSHVFQGANFISLNAIIELSVYYLLVALCEEIVFRGYINTRLHGLIKNQYLVIIVSGILFVCMHFPYRMIVSGLTLSDLVIHNTGWLLDLFITHIILSLIYLKTNSLYGAILPHWMSNLAYNLIIR